MTTERYPGGQRTTHTAEVTCPACGTTQAVTVITVDEPRTHDYPGAFDQWIAAGAICGACGRRYTPADLITPEEEDA
jgi:hypothetical protein